MADYVDIEKVIELANSYKAKRLPLPEPDRYLGFTKHGKLFLMVVHGKKIYIGYVERFKKWLEEEE